MITSMNEEKKKKMDAQLDAQYTVVNYLDSARSNKQRAPLIRVIAVAECSLFSLTRYLHSFHYISVNNTSSCLNTKSTVSSHKYI